MATGDAAVATPGPLVGEPGRAVDPASWFGPPAGSREVVLLLNAQLVVAYASPSVTERLGYAADDLVGLPVDDIVHPDDLPAMWRSRADGFDEPRRTPPVARLRSADGGYRWFEWCAAPGSGRDLPTLGEGGAGQAIVVRARDITQQVNLEQRLAALDARHRALLQSLAEGVVFLDGELRVQLVNPAACRLLGRNPHDLVGRTYFDALNLWDENGHQLTMSSPFVVTLLRATEPVEAWRGVERADGSRLVLHKRWTPLWGANRADRGFLLTMQRAIGGGAGGPSQALRLHHLKAQAAAGLTPREGEVLDALAAGEDVPVIARSLGLTVSSVRGHIKRLMRKLGTHTQLQTVVVAARAGLVDVHDEGAPSATP